MMTWWSELSSLTRIFYCVAAFFSVFFVWQMVSMLLGLGGDGSADGDAPAHGASGGDAVETMHAFELLSIRSVITFLTLFSWGSALYLSAGKSVGFALGVSCLWGGAGMVAVAALLYVLPKLAQTGTQNIATAVGSLGKVYLDIPEGGEGEVRAEVSGVLTHVRARTANGRALKAGAAVTVTRVLCANLVEVQPAEPPKV